MSNEPPFEASHLVGQEHTVVQHEGFVLGYDWDDVESVEFETPRDVREYVVDGAIRREFGKAHLNVKITFKEGRQALWADGSK